MSDAVLVALIGAIAAIAGGLLTMWNNGRTERTKAKALANEHQLDINAQQVEAYDHLVTQYRTAADEARAELITERLAHAETRADLINEQLAHSNTLRRATAAERRVDEYLKKES